MHRLYVAVIGLALMGCRAHLVESTLLTEETRKSMRNACNQYLPEGTRQAAQIEWVKCASGRDKDNKLNLATTGLEFIKSYHKTLKEEGRFVLQDKPDQELSPDQNMCLEDVSEFFAEIVADLMVKKCRDQSVPTARLASYLPYNQTDRSCWRFVRMDEDACIAARACRGPSDVGTLWITAESRLNVSGLVKEGDGVRLCNKSIAQAYELKDPSRAMVPFNLAFAHLLSNGRSAPSRSFAAANCHGTASILAGNALDDSVVTKVTYHSLQLQQDCLAQAEQFLADRREDLGGPVTAADLPITTTGHSINMNHDPTCSESDCGVISYNVLSCDRGVLGNIFYDDMCINCWAKRLEAAGLKEVNSPSMSNIRPGCLLTVSDHSTVFLHSSNGFCYYFEATTPYGPPQLQARSCLRYIGNDHRMWCPQEPMQFRLSAKSPLLP